MVYHVQYLILNGAGLNCFFSAKSCLLNITKNCTCLLLVSLHISCLNITIMYYLDSISKNLDKTTLSKPVEEGRLSPPKFLKNLPEPPAYDESPGAGG